MTGARILKWHLTAPGDFVDCYDLILEIEADNLVDEGSRSTLEIEQRPQMLCPLVRRNSYFAAVSMDN